MALMTNMFCHRKSGVYFFRRAIPKRLRAAFNSKLEFIKSLGTKDLEEARRRNRKLGAEVQELFDQAEAKLVHGEMPAPPKFDVPAGTQFFPRIDPRDGKAKWFALPPEPSIPVASFDEHGRFVPDPLKPAAVLTKQTAGKRFSEILDRWVEAEERRPQTISEWRTAVKRFVEICGDLALEAIRKADINKFLVVLKQLPARPSLSLRALPLVEQAAIGKTLQKNKCLNPATIQKHIAALSALVTFANDKVFDISIANPFPRMKPSLPANRKNSRRPWTSGELTTLFHSPVFVGCLSTAKLGLPGDTMIWDHHYWLPLLGIFTGARLGELVQLQVSDFRREGDFWVLDMLDLDDGDDDDDSEGSASKSQKLEKRFKSASSRRLVPVHEQLLRLGFQEYVDKQRRSNEALLFPRLHRSHTSEKAAKGFSKWFGKYRRTAVGVKGRGTNFHSFRHGFKDRLREVTQSDEIRNRLCGHSAKTVGETYGQGDSLRTLSDVVNKVAYAGLDLSHLESTTRNRIAAPRAA